MLEFGNHRYNINSIIAILDRIYCNFSVPTTENSESYVTLFLLGLRIKLLDFAFIAFSTNVRNLEQGIKYRLRRLLSLKDRMSLEKEFLPVLYYTENYLLQLRIVMDYWAVYFSYIPGYDNLGLSFNKHKKNIKRIKDKDEIYSDYVVNMDWFDDMKVTRDEIKSKKMKFIIFDKTRGCYILTHAEALGFQQLKSKDDPGIIELLSRYHNCFWDYNEFVFKHFEQAD